uniref:Uncharacterized protein n=1 Tax=Trichogramma kaykai TaxID=54128 RepID=A0ABD2WEX6_9HYME
MRALRNTKSKYHISSWDFWTGSRRQNSRRPSCNVYIHIRVHHLQPLLLLPVPRKSRFNFECLPVLLSSALENASLYFARQCAGTSKCSSIEAIGSSPPPPRSTERIRKANKNIRNSVTKLHRYKKATLATQHQRQYEFCE